MEIWKPVTGMENRYAASNAGKIKGLIQYGRHNAGRILTTCLDERGYEKIYIMTDSGKRTTRVHILVCLAFHGVKPTNEHTVNHKDGNKLNNTPDNLGWATRQEQSIHFYTQLNGKEKRPRGHGIHWRANYTDDEVRLIRKLHASGMSYHKLCDYFNHRTTWVPLQAIVKKRTYSHVVD